jgi:hypothetical protein
MEPGPRAVRRSDMGRWSRLALGALALTVTAAGCGVADPSATPSRSSGAGTGAAATRSPSAGAPSPTPAASRASSATLIAFVMVRAAGTGGATEVSGPDQIDRLVDGPPAAIATARAAVARNSGADTRLFAFVLAGCQNDGAALAIQPGRITATLTGGEGIACLVAEWYLAVFAVPDDLAPQGTRVG